MSYYYGEIKIYEIIDFKECDMHIYKNSDSENKSFENMETYSYDGKEVVIVTVFKTGINSIAIVEDVNTGEQYEVLRDKLY